MTKAVCETNLRAAFGAFVMAVDSWTKAEICRDCTKQSSLEYSIKRGIPVYTYGIIQVYSSMMNYRCGTSN
jgi:hypothetical protein